MFTNIESQSTNDLQTQQQIEFIVIVLECDDLLK